MTTPQAMHENQQQIASKNRKYSFILIYMWGLYAETMNCHYFHLIKKRSRKWISTATIFTNRMGDQ